MSQPSSTPPTGKPTGDAIQAVQDALATEHAAVWTYGLVSAFLKEQADQTAAGANSHRARRDATERILRDTNAEPVPPAPAYLPPAPVTDAASSIAALVAVEIDGCTAWRGVLDRTEDQDLRRSALDALTSCAVRATRWRKTGGLTPTSLALPGTAVG
ncbi:ferritin-like domain-containing protein [Umezawaea tangerina]|uniref:Uncharacterized protein DUF4439 n=1 Tax=Umezawaea tangerina TaxID=84725 RepID=A0A2T0TA78_9PSEU|nr:ferritin-like domain-containing protein [Umezawaea tangerina]PRY42561.1 uncharacterized protein DUF4439 [Umezawaea tangerina]